MIIKVQGIVYCNIKGIYKILILKRSEIDGGFWQTLTGTPTKNESNLECLRREIMEEIGVGQINSISPLIYKYCWNKGGVEVREYVYAVYVNKGKIVLSEEHTNYAWVDYHKAITLIDKEGILNSLEKFNKYVTMI